MLENNTTILTSKEEQDKKMANIAKVLSNPLRLRILRLLANQKECFSGSLHEVLCIPRATISQNLQMLKDVGLVRCEFESTKVKYCINQENLDAARTMFAAFFSNCMKEKDDKS